MTVTSNSETGKLTGFDVVQSNYKTVDDHGIRADFLIPKVLPKGKRPVIVFFHGGCLITGDSLFLNWFPQWVFDLSQKHGAVIVSPNHRLLPEATSLEIIEDVEDFWSWLHSTAVMKLMSSHSNPTELDLTRVITSGASAGGLLSICLALLYPDSIRSATASYPTVDMASYDVPRAIPAFNPPGFIPESVAKLIEDKTQPGVVISSDLPLSRVALAMASIEQGKLTEMYERGTEHLPRREVRYPLERLDSPDAKIPRGGIAILHGRQDTLVPVEHSEKFVAKVRKAMKGKAGGDKVFLVVRDGGHGFDNATKLDEEWLSDLLKGAVGTWLE
ncbi:hypothetical protein MPDQ_005395 [Monascus purpureus]|uniref:Alpha/beta hydrolase fold-3 domain-containing protein n=1 Tax=Monascus purpureus TaxID=5098 RepID=A0A507R0H7_MONPU|nr:hypothetical protein MPDQ_005395 [Monascus purpureus]BDD60084.1 hypothetical protein MAP00_005247 [Monascus purpureus]